MMLRKMMKRDSGRQLRVDCAGRALLIDSDALDLDTYSEVLAKQGHEVVPCDSYAEAAERLRGDNFDLVVLDEGGANFEARGFLEELAQRAPHIPTLVLGRTLDVRHYLTAMELGADDYLEKPVSPNELRRAIERNLAPRVSFVPAVQ